MKATIVGTCLGIFGCATSISRPEPTGVVTEFGLYQNLPRMPHPAGVNLVTTEDWGTLKRHTRKVPAQIGVLFGFCYTLSGLDRAPVKLRWVVQHPSMRGPRGENSNGYSYIRTVTPERGRYQSCSGYRFQRTGQLVPGEWRFQYWLGSQKLLEQRFRVYLPV